MSLAGDSLGCYGKDRGLQTPAMVGSVPDSVLCVAQGDGGGEDEAGLHFQAQDPLGLRLGRLCQQVGNSRSIGPISRPLITIKRLPPKQP